MNKNQKSDQIRPFGTYVGTKPSEFEAQDITFLVTMAIYLESVMPGIIRKIGYDITIASCGYHSKSTLQGAAARQRFVEIQHTLESMRDEYNSVLSQTPDALTAAQYFASLREEDDV